MKNFKAGYFQNQGSFKSFQPTLINKDWTLSNMEIINLLSKADRAIGRLDTFSEQIPNIDLFIQMHIIKEANQSSKIEGTQTNIEEALLSREDINEEKRDDWEEVQNYIKALNTAIEELNRLPFSSKLIRKTHGSLLSGVRGKHKLPATFRTSQNWIGGATISDAKFIPPTHSSVIEYMSDLEKFAHYNETLPDLLKIALIHYQFETIHPFLDGNGRVGRLMITLYLVEKGILSKPVLYLSDFFERNRSLYYDNLTNVRLKNDLEQWFKFFLVGVIETAKHSVDTFKKIVDLKQRTETELQALKGRSNKALIILNHLFKEPLLSVAKCQLILGCTQPTASKLLEDLQKLGILEEVTGTKRKRIFVFEEYLRLF